MPVLERITLTVALLAASSFSLGADFTLSSPSIQPGSTLTLAQVYDGYGCKGKNISPALNWSGAPAATKSFVVTLFDPDAPTGAGWWHWLVFNLPAGATGLAAGAGTPDGKALPAGARQGLTDFDTAAFGGACPPKGDKAHRYVFTVHALSADKLEVPADAKPAQVVAALKMKLLASASLTAKYAR